MAAGPVKLMFPSFCTPSMDPIRPIQFDKLTDSEIVLLFSDQPHKFQFVLATVDRHGTKQASATQTAGTGPVNISIENPASRSDTI